MIRKREIRDFESGELSGDKRSGKIKLGGSENKERVGFMFQKCTLASLDLCVDICDLPRFGYFRTFGLGAGIFPTREACHCFSIRPIYFFFELKHCHSIALYIPLA